MRFLSICSGIEAASVAWGPLGWSPVGFSEIEPFPCALLEHRYPEVPNFGDMTKFYDWPIESGSIDLLAGGTPCQGFSFAGLREGLDDPRSQLSLTFGEMAAKLRPRWLVWENVPGVLSSGGGADFAAILGILTGRKIPVPQGGFQNSGWIEGIPEAYGVAWIVRDAQYFGVPQRRRRVFLVGYLGDVRGAAAVLFECHGLQRNSPPRREAGKGVAGTLNARAKSGGGLGTDFDLDGGLIANSIIAGNGHASCSDGVPSNLVAEAFGGGNTSGPVDAVPSLLARGQRVDFETETFITEPIGFTGGSAPSEGIGTLTSSQGRSLHSGGLPCVAFQEAQTGVREYETAGTLRANGPGHDPVGTHLRIGMAVRRLTPRECERLQGFPDDYTLIPTKKRRQILGDDLAYLLATYPEMTLGEAMKLAADGPRYKALGNSWAIPPAQWIGQRIKTVDAMIRAGGLLK
jgi:DNA (cytosine-5)-methyltransferase 1